MRVSFDGFESPIELAAGFPHVLEIENKTLFTRVCQSLLSEEGSEAREPYSLWDEAGEEVSSRGAFLSVSNPLDLPWDDKLLGGRLYDVFEGLMGEDEETRSEIERIAQSLSSAVSRPAHCVGAEYEFGLEWGMKQFLKSRAFKVDRHEASPFLESLISFLDFCSDMGLKQAVLFVNLKTFLSGREVQELYERLFFLGFEALLLESQHDSLSYEHERKTMIDLQFLESH